MVATFYCTILTYWGSTFSLKCSDYLLHGSIYGAYVRTSALLLVYLLSGIGGNLLSLAFGSDKVISAGASTALFGLFGAMTAIGLRNMKNPMISYLGRQAFVLAIVNIALDLFAPNIDIQGHIGGFVAGFLLAIIVGDRTMRKYNPKWRVVAAAVLIVYVVWTVRLGMVVKF